MTPRLLEPSCRAEGEAHFGREIRDEELEELFHRPWIVLPPIMEITGALNALRKAIAQIEVAA